MGYKFGIMPEHDYRTIEHLLDEIATVFPSGIICTLEIGVHRGDTSRGIHKFFEDRNRVHFHTGIDNQRDFAMGSPFPECNFIVSDSMTAAWQVPDESQHLVFIDGCHNYPMTMVDFLLYSDKVKRGGYIAFHDTGAHIPPMKDYQGMGSKDDPTMYISCRKALEKLGLLSGYLATWELVVDDADPSKDTGGITVFKRML